MNDPDPILIPAGEYLVGIDASSALEWCRRQASGSPARLHDEAGWILPMKAALRSVRVRVADVWIGAFRPGPIEHREAARRAEAEGGRLLSEIEWEIAERYVARLSVPGADEWCREPFDWSCTHHVEEGSPEAERAAHEFSRRLDRHVIRGASFSVYHPCLRFYGAGDDAPYAMTGYRIAYDHEPRSGARF